MTTTILIVDDEPSGQEALESVLLNQGYEMAFAANGAEALQKAEALHPDLILLDVMMPDMDGFEVCRRLRSSQHVAEAPVVLVTALDDRESRLIGIEAGADDFIAKPIDRAELRARVRTITRLNRYRLLVEERQKLERQLERMTALRAIDLAVTAFLDLRITLDVLLRQITTQLHIDAACVLLLNPDSMVLEFAAGRGFRDRTVEMDRFRLGEGAVGRAALERRTLHLTDVEMALMDENRAAIMHTHHFQSYHSVPLLAKGEIKGMLEVFHNLSWANESEQVDFLEMLGRQAAIAVDNAQLFASLQRSNADLMHAYEATLEGWSRALDLRDKETEGHTQRVTEVTLQLAQAFGLNENDLVHVRRGALLHDIGKLGVPDSILRKPGPLTPDEWVIMRKHPVYAYELLSPIPYLRPALDIPYYHHENWDGKGYPHGLAGEQIPLAARIFAVVEAWDALRSDRPYRPSWPKQAVLAHLQAEAGKRFDPRVVQAFLELATTLED